MGYDFQKDERFNNEKFATLLINLPKHCYFPGETINGTLILKAKLNGSNTILSNPLVDFNLFQWQRYNHQSLIGKNNRSETVELKNSILTISANFSNLAGSNFSSGLTIPFKIELPLNIHPTCIFDKNDFVKHLFTVDFPSISVRKTKLIIIKNNPNFTTFNGLFKQPLLLAENFKKKKNFFKNSGSVSSNLTIPKNVFKYDEQIPFELDLDCTKLNMGIKGVEISIVKSQRKNFKLNFKESVMNYIETLIIKKIKVDKNQKIHHIADTIALPEKNNPKIYFSPKVYEMIEKNNTKSDFDNLKVGYKIEPSCLGGLLNVEYFLKVRLCFANLLTFDETFSIPIDFSWHTEQVDQNTSPAINDRKKINPNKNQEPFSNQNVVPCQSTARLIILQENNSTNPQLKSTNNKDIDQQNNNVQTKQNLIPKEYNEPQQLERN